MPRKGHTPRQIIHKLRQSSDGPEPPKHQNVARRARTCARAMRAERAKTRRETAPLEGEW